MGQGEMSGMNCRGVQLSEGTDNVYWALERSRKYSTRSLNKLMTGIVEIQMMAVWKYNNPLKVKVFLWMAAHDRIQPGVHLKKRQWSGPENCKVCDKLEKTDRILFQCSIAVFFGLI